MWGPSISLIFLGNRKVVMGFSWDYYALACIWCRRPGFITLWSLFMARGRTDVWTRLTISEALFLELQPYLFKMVSVWRIKAHLLFLLPQVRCLSLFILLCFNAAHHTQFTHFSPRCCNLTRALTEEPDHGFYSSDTFKNVGFNIWRVNICL